MSLTWLYNKDSFQNSYLAMLQGQKLHSYLSSFVKNIFPLWYIFQFFQCITPDHHSPRLSDISCLDPLPLLNFLNPMGMIILWILCVILIHNSYQGTWGLTFKIYFPSIIHPPTNIYLRTCYLPDIPFQKQKGKILKQSLRQVFKRLCEFTVKRNLLAQISLWSYMMHDL